eukprot:CAMPEP_0167756286 /NCGR_PEP_ID=MMETSP0110_2-20121227/9299_1 /TAXON_ID=629695 /ORGANISM="Gymnochlora sp., Strain CCMP2014" /LENGTH=269 /DNA_ID=CAMNT_0007642375 /DNA_START=21 /DNA_END=830 /DNA_ORIENTATION=+
MSENPGMMGEAYFVGKRQLLSWINTFLGLNYTKVEQTASAVAYCQILDAIFPGKVPLHKVDFDAKYDYDFVKNFKIIQNVFDKMSVQKRVPVQRLVKAKYQDNLEFLQWFKNFFDVRYGGNAYDAHARKNIALKKQGKKTLPRAPKISSGTGKETKGSSVASKKKYNSMKRTTTKSATKSTASRTSDSKLKSKVAGLEAKVEEMNSTIGLLEKERSFYYNKLRDVELLLQDATEEKGLKDKVLDILYKTDEGFEAPPVEEEVEGGPTEF